METRAEPRLHRWLDRPLLGVAVIVAAAGFAQFGPTAVLADVAREFGELRDGDTIAEQAGLPGSVLGAGLAAIRLAAMAALVLTGLADIFGRRRMMLAYVSLGLAVAVIAAGSPTFWWFVVAFVVARPLLTATTALGQVVAAEHTGVSDRAKAIAFVAAAFGVGSGSVAVLRGVFSDLSFRAVFALAAVPLALVWIASRLVAEPDRYRARVRSGIPVVPVLGAIHRGRRGRLAVMAVLGFTSGLVIGPINTFLFLYAENILGVSKALTAVLAVLAAPVGLAGLLLGRYLADHVGRRPAGAVALVAFAAMGPVTYSGSVSALVVGYLLGIMAGAAYGTPASALANELFPTSSRASVAGWMTLSGVLGSTAGLLLVGAIADATGSFGRSMTAVAVPTALSALLVVLLPETRGMELEQSAPELADETPAPVAG